MAENIETMAMNNFKNRVTTIIEKGYDKDGHFIEKEINFDGFVNYAVSARKVKFINKLFGSNPKEGLGVSAKTIDKENEIIKICWKDVATIQSGNGSSGRYSVVILNEDADIHGIADAISAMANAKLIINSCFFYAGSKKILTGLSTEVRGMSVAVQKAEELNDKKEKLEDAIEEHNDDVKKLDEDTTDFNKDVEKHNEKVDKNEKAVENAKTDTDAEKAQKEQEKLKQEAEALEKQRQEMEKQRQEMEKQRQELEKQKKQVEQEQQAAQTQLAKTNTPEKVATVEPVTIQIVQTEEKPAKIEQPKETAAPATKQGGAGATNKEDPKAIEAAKIAICAEPKLFFDALQGKDGAQKKLEARNMLDDRAKKIIDVISKIDHKKIKILLEDDISSLPDCWVPINQAAVDKNALSSALARALATYIHKKADVQELAFGIYIKTFTKKFTNIKEFKSVTTKVSDTMDGIKGGF